MIVRPFVKLLGQLQDRGNVTTIRNYLELLEKGFLRVSAEI